MRLLRPLQILFDLYHTKSTDISEVISKLNIQKTVFRSPFWIISDKELAFNSKPFEDYRTQENIHHIKIIMFLLSANGQVDSQNSVVIFDFSKLSLDNPIMWYTQMSSVLYVINWTFQISVNITLFEFLLSFFRLKWN